MVIDIDVRTRAFDRFAAFLPKEQLAVQDEMRRAFSANFEGRVSWHVNTTSVGGGVAEMLRQHVAYGRGSGVDSRWVVVSGGPEFFRITKRLHHALHGSPGDGSPIGERERGVYEETLRQNAVELAARVRPRDVVTLHDPQTAGLAPHLIRSGAVVIWRCHIGCDTPSPEVELAWNFLRPYLEDVPGYIFTRPTYVPPFCEADRVQIIPPTIDIFAAKNRELDEATVRSVLVHVGLIDGPLTPGTALRFERSDGTPGRVERQADIVRLGRAPHWDTPLVVQVSRWDTLKDPIGVMRGFARFLENTPPRRADLVIAGPNVHAVNDDPEAEALFGQVLETWRALPHAERSRIHLVSLPTSDVEENAVIVNALQRHAAVVVQKSLAEGFGLTVTEAMWKARPLIASAVGGIQDQIEDGVSGLLLKDPRSSDEFAAALHRLLGDGDLATRLGAVARQRAIDLFLDARSLLLQGSMIQKLAHV